KKGETIPLITADNFKDYQKIIGQSEGTDVTGGMIHKVKEALGLAREGVPGLIIDGISNGVLSKAVLGEKVLGTEIRSTS
ncbi:MAG: amino acid kinase, partial [Candidatus Zixiibacteriota bacterium]